MNAALSRRRLLAGSAALVIGGPSLSACSSAARDTLVPVAGEFQQAGEPLWSRKTNSFVVAVDQFASTQLVALVNECTYETNKIGTIGWCRSSQTFVCASCGAEWAQNGDPRAVASLALTQLGVSVTETDDVLVDKSSRRESTFQSEPNPIRATCVDLKRPADTE
jgi:hypothetical protein